MKGIPPSRYFFHDGTKYTLTGNEGLAMSHFHEVRAHLKLMKMTNVQQLPIVFGSKEFDDGTVAKFQLIHGKELIEVYAPSFEEGEEFVETELEDYEQIVPCMIVTAEDDVDEILGYIACMSGSFLGDYKWFPASANDAVLVLEGFYPKGHNGYIEEVAFSTGRVLGTVNEDTLSYISPSGICPDDSRFYYDQSLEVDTEIETFIGGHWTDFDDGIYLYTAAVGTTITSGSKVVDRPLLFDDNRLIIHTDWDVSEPGEYSIWLGEAMSCGSDEQQCQDDIAELKATEIPMLPFTHNHLNTYAFNRNLLYYSGREYLYAGSNGRGVRVNSKIDESAYLFVQRHTKKNNTYWNDLGEPTPYNFSFSINYCTGCYTIDETYTSTLYIRTNDTNEHNITDFFGWHPESAYEGLAVGCNLIYHGKGKGSISLASALAYDEDDYYGPGRMAFVYVGPAANDLEGSVSFHVDDVSEEYVDIHAAFPGMVPNSVVGGLRGHVFLGTVATEGQEVETTTEVI